MPTDPASVPVTVAAAPTESPATGATTFLSLPRELRDLIYSYLFEAVYTQSRRNVDLKSKALGGARKKVEADRWGRLAILQASRRVWEEGSRILYGKHLFRFDIGNTTFTKATFLTRRVANLMQDIEISLGRCKTPDSVQILRLFGSSQIPRKSCFIKLQSRQPKPMHSNTIEALKQLTGFKVLTFEVHAPGVVHYWHSDPIPWVSGILAFMQVKLTQALGPGTYANGDGCRRLVFKPQDHRGHRTEKQALGDMGWYCPTLPLAQTGLGKTDTQA